MTKPRTYQVLNRLLRILCRSLPMYLEYASPWTREGDEKAVQALNHIIADQKATAQRIASHVLDHYGPVETGEFPSEFTDTNDLSLDYLLGKMVECQKNDIAAIESCIAQLSDDRRAAALAEEALGAARGHLETLEELRGELSKPSSWAY